MLGVEVPGHHQQQLPAILIVSLLKTQRTLASPAQPSSPPPASEQCLWILFKESYVVWGCRWGLSRCWAEQSQLEIKTIILFKFSDRVDPVLAVWVAGVVHSVWVRPPRVPLVPICAVGGWRHHRHANHSDTPLPGTTNYQSHSWRAEGKCKRHSQSHLGQKLFLNVGCFRKYSKFTASQK